MLTFITKKYIVAPLTIQSNDPVFEIDRMSTGPSFSKRGLRWPKTRRQNRPTTADFQGYLSQGYFEEKLLVTERTGSQILRV